MVHVKGRPQADLEDRALARLGLVVDPQAHGAVRLHRLLVELEGQRRRGERFNPHPGHRRHHHALVHGVAVAQVLLELFDGRMQRHEAALEGLESRLHLLDLGLDRSEGCLDDRFGVLALRVEAAGPEKLGSRRTQRFLQRPGVPELDQNLAGPAPDGRRQGTLVMLGPADGQLEQMVPALALLHEAPQAEELVLDRLQQGRYRVLVEGVGDGGRRRR